MEKRTLTFNLRLTPKERAMLEKMAEAKGISIADVIRQAIRRWFASNDMKDAA